MGPLRRSRIVSRTRGELRPQCHRSNGATNLFRLLHQITAERRKRMERVVEGANRGRGIVELQQQACFPIGTVYRDIPCSDSRSERPLPLEFSAHGDRVAMGEVVLHLEYVVAAGFAAMHIADPDRLERQSHRHVEHGEPQPFPAGRPSPAAHAFVDAFFANAQTLRRPTKSGICQ